MSVIAGLTKSREIIKFAVNGKTKSVGVFVRFFLSVVGGWFVDRKEEKDQSVGK